MYFLVTPLALLIQVMCNCCYDHVHQHTCKDDLVANAHAGPCVMCMWGVVVRRAGGTINAVVSMSAGLC